MYFSNTTQKEFLDAVAADLCLLEAPTRDALRASLNDILYRLYTEEIAERTAATVTCAADGTLAAAALPHPTRGSATPCPEDICTVRAEGEPYVCVPAHLFSRLEESGGRFFTLTEDGIRLAPVPAGGVTVAFLSRPAGMSAQNEGSVVPFPVGYLPLLSSYIKGEAYLAAGEDALAARFRADFNARLADFREALARERERRGRA